MTPLPRWTRTGVILVGLCVLVPLILGGCPEFRNDVVGAADTAVRGLINAALDLLFNQFRNQDIG